MGPDQHIWFTSLMNNRVGKIDTFTYEISLFHDSTNALIMPANIYPDSNNMLWFTCVGSHHLARIDPFSRDPSASIQLFSHQFIKNPVAIKRSRNGNLWFSARGSNVLGYINPEAADPEKSIHIFKHPNIYSPAAIFITPNDQLFFTNNESNNSGVGYLDCSAKHPNESILIHPFLDKKATHRAWAQDNQNKMWLTIHEPDLLVCFDPNSFIHNPEFFLVEHPEINKPDGIYLADDGFLYFVNTGSSSIGKLDPLSPDPSSTLQIYTHNSLKGLCDIKPGPNRSMWFTDKGGNAIGRLVS